MIERPLVRPEPFEQHEIFVGPLEGGHMALARVPFAVFSTYTRQHPK